MKSMMIFLSMMFQSLLVFAAEHADEAAHAEGHAHGPDGTLIMYQAINVGAIIIGLVYFLRKPVKEFFAAKKSEYLEASQKTLAAKVAAEKDLAAIRAELARVETTASESVSRARAESADMRKQMVADAEVAAKRIRDEADNSVRIETQKAISALRTELIQEGVAAARKQMSGGVSQEDHQRLNKEFIRSIEAVQP